jgi:hypothetical protein
MTDHVQTSADTATTIVAKIAPPATVSLATVLGVQVNELVLWATLIYTSLLIGHKLWSMYKEFKQ